jgi:hypothetical protein
MQKLINEAITDLLEVQCENIEALMDRVTDLELKYQQTQCIIKQLAERIIALENE